MSQITIVHTDEGFIEKQVFLKALSLIENRFYTVSVNNASTTDFIDCVVNAHQSLKSDNNFSLSDQRDSSFSYLSRDFHNRNKATLSDKTKTLIDDIKQMYGMQMVHDTGNQFIEVKINNAETIRLNVNDWHIAIPDAIALIDCVEQQVANENTENCLFVFPSLNETPYAQSVIIELISELAHCNPHWQFIIGTNIIETITTFELGQYQANNDPTSPYSNAVFSFVTIEEADIALDAYYMKKKMGDTYVSQLKAKLP